MPTATHSEIHESAIPDAKTRAKGGRLGGIAKVIVLLIAALLTLVAAVIGFSSRQTNADVAALQASVAAIGTATVSPVYSTAAVSHLPQPVQRYFAYTFVEPPAQLEYVTVEMAGEFRRPLTESFSPTTAEQTFAVGTPSLMFAARTGMIPGVWALAYDYYAEGSMEMKAKIMSTLTVVDESETPALNQTSLQRWLLESPLYPAALLPGGPVRWEAIDDSHARAIVSADGLEASLVATFRADGSLESLMAEHDGDLTTPYHGSGEHVARGDYRLVDGLMLPHSFTISRAAGGELYPFWTGEIEAFTIQPAD
ncbi:MAG: DUF6920 family protein [Beutenbergiaceae bacterium]